MLLLLDRLQNAKYHELMSVYEESILADAALHYKKLDHGIAVQYAQQDLYTYLDDIFFKTDGACLALWEDGFYRAALRLEPYRDGFLITALETEPHSRRKGYGMKLLQAVTGKYPILYSHVDRSNPASMQCHLKAGFFRSLDHSEFIDGTVHPECVTLKYAAESR